MTSTIDNLIKSMFLLQLYSTLKSSIDGRAILKKKHTGKLEESQRNILVKLLLQPISEKDPNATISNTQLLSWSLEIQEIFVKESAALYYTPYISALVQTTARNASGKLLRYVYNKRQQMRNHYPPVEEACFFFSFRPRIMNPLPSSHIHFFVFI